MNFFSDILEKLNPFRDQQQNSGTTPVSLIDSGPLVFPVGEGLTPEQKTKARETIQKQTKEPYKVEGAPKNFFEDIISTGKKVTEPISKLNQVDTTEKMIFRVGEGLSQPEAAAAQAKISEITSREDKTFGMTGPNAEDVGNFFADVLRMPVRGGVKIFQPTGEYVPDTQLEKLLLGNEPVPGIAQQAAEIEMGSRELGSRLKENSIFSKVLQNKQFSTTSGVMLSVAGTFLDVYPGAPKKSLVEKEVAAFVTKKAAEGLTEKQIIKQVEKQFGKEIADKAAVALPKTVQELETFKGFQDQTTSVLEDLVGRKSVSKQYIQDSLKQPSVREAERNVFNEVLKQYPEGSKIPVNEFADKVKAELLPLTPKTVQPRYENISLNETRGSVENYKERIYQSPIKTDAGQVHFNKSSTPNYFAHTRIEDMSNNSTRRVIEIQSDLFQKGSLDRKTLLPHDSVIQYNNKKYYVTEDLGKEIKLYDKDAEKALTVSRSQLLEQNPELASKENLITRKLSPYENTWHERVIREEFKQAAADGKKILQFPTGETAMKIEGLAGDQTPWGVVKQGQTWRDFSELKPTDLKVGMEIARDYSGERWIVTDIQDELVGTFKAVPKRDVDEWGKGIYKSVDETLEAMKKEGDYEDLLRNSESFSLSRSVDKTNPIYKFYESRVAKAVMKVDPNAKVITDKQGVSWLQASVSKDLAEKPVVAFGKAAPDLNLADHFDFNLTREEATKKLRELFDDTEVRFLVRNDLIKGRNIGQFTPNAPISVYSSISRPLIEVVQNEGKIASSVLYHESFHAYLNTFVDEKVRKELINKTKKNFLARLSQNLEDKSVYKTAELRAEEWLANDFAKFVAGKDFEGQQFKGIYQKILDKVRSWIRKATGAQQIYDDILGRVRPAAEITPGAGERAFNATEYVAEQVRKREEARGQKSSFAAKLGGFLKDIKAKLVDANAPIEDVLRRAEKEGQFKVLPTKDISNAIDRVYRAPVLAGQFAKDNGLVDVIKNVPDVNTLDQYMIAKHAIELDKLGIKTGRDLAADAELIKAVGPEYEEFAKKVTGYSRKLLDYSVESGLISRDLADKLVQTYPDYVPFNRVFEETEKGLGQFNTRAVASLSKQTVVQRIQGSEREIESPVASLLKKTTDAFVQGEKNKAAAILSAYESLPGNPMQITPLRTYENVTERISLYSEAKELKPVQRKIEGMLSRKEGQLKQLQREINRFEKQGLAAALTREPKELQLTGRKTDVKKMIDQLIIDPNSDVAALKRKVATRENKLGPLLDEIEEAKQMYEDIHSYRMGLIDEARLKKDAEAKGLDTFAVLKNGVKEIYSTTPEIAAAAKQLNVQQLNVLGRIFAMPVRLAKLGITGINLPFVGANIARDQLFTMITSEKTLKTSLANPAVFLDSLFAAVKHNNLYEDLVRAGAGGTSFDIARNALPETIERVRAGRSVGSRIAYTVKNPSQLLRTVEDIVGRGEELTRLQQFEGTRRALLAEGRTMADATIEAAKAARQNSANFARHGEWGPVLNSAFLYLNASIQGSRTLIQAFAKRPIQTASKIATLIFTPLAAITAWNLSDPKRREAYLDIARYEKDNNFVIIPPNPTQDDKGRWNVIKIPITPGLSNLTIPVRRTLEWAYGTQKPEVWDDVAKPLIGTVSPIEPDAGSIASALTPQAIRPSLESLTNQSFFTGKKQVPDSMKDLSPELQVKPYTSGTARKIGKTIKASPIKVEEFIRGTFGGVGSQALNLMDRALAGMDIIPKSQVGGQNVVEGVTARFSKAYGGTSDDQSVSEIKKILTNQADERFLTKQAAEALYEELKALPKDEANAKAKELQKVNKPLFDALKKTIDEDKKGLTYEDRLINQIGVENGERAKFIWAKLKEMKTKDEKNNYVNELKRKGIISETVFNQLKQLSQKGK